MFNKEIFIYFLEGVNTDKTVVFQYHNESLFNTMLGRFRKWESQNKIHILDVRNSIYTTSEILEGVK